MADPPSPPPLPARLTRTRDVIAVGALLWLVAAGVLLLVRPVDVRFVTCVVGVVLGGLGYGVFTWQRAAARRGSRLAQQGLEDQR